MKLKNTCLIILVLPIIINTARCQNSESKFYIKLYGGYGLSTAGSWTTSSMQNIPDPLNPGQQQTPYQVSTALGQGLHYGGGLGYIINEFLNVGVDCEYLKSKNILADNLFQSNDGSYYSISNMTISNSVLSIIPNVTFKALSKPSYYIYTRVGIVIAVNTKMQQNSIDSSNAPIDLTHSSGLENDDFTFKTSIGVQAAFGAQFRITQKIRGFAELVGYWLPAVPSSMEGVSTSTTYDPTSSIDPKYTKTIFKLSYIKSGQVNFKYTPPLGTGATPSDPVTSNYSYNSPVIIRNINYLGINIGVAYRF